MWVYSDVCRISAQDYCEWNEVGSSKYAYRRLSPLNDCSVEAQRISAGSEPDLGARSTGQIASGPPSETAVGGVIYGIHARVMYRGLCVCLTIHVHVAV